MQGIEVPREAWVGRLNEFTVIHEGWLVSLDVLAANVDTQPAIHNLPLLGISADVADAGGRIAISVARSRMRHLTRIIESVKRLYVDRRYDGAEAALEIESAAGTRTIMRVRATPLPGQTNRAVFS